jgi:phosphoribosylformimino-5-aminoimidazole carboxamide ribotide isomerase
MEIIAAIDIIEGKCVRLSKGDFSQKKIYNENPFEVAKQFEDAGIKRLHLVDLDGAKTGEVKNWKALESIVSKTSLIIDFGGGIKSEEDVTTALNIGASLIAIGSMAVKNKTEFVKWLTQFGSEKFLLGADVKNKKIVVHGWTETTDLIVYDFIEKYMQRGIKQIFCTDVSKDGMLKGPSVKLYQSIIEKFKDIDLIASGGVSSTDDINILEDCGCKGVIIGKAFYEGKILLKELKRYVV